jgi:hypothetical protein
MNDIERGWLAGFLEGEAYFHFAVYRRNGMRNGIPRKPYLERSIWIRVTSTDRDVLNRVLTLTGTGFIKKRKIVSPLSKKTQWEWMAQQRKPLRGILEEIEPLLGQRRKEAVAPMLEYLAR